MDGLFVTIRRSRKVCKRQWRVLESKSPIRGVLCLPGVGLPQFSAIVIHGTCTLDANSEIDFRVQSVCILILSHLSQHCSPLIHFPNSPPIKYLAVELLSFAIDYPCSICQQNRILISCQVVGKSVSNPYFSTCFFRPLLNLPVLFQVPPQSRH